MYLREHRFAVLGNHGALVTVERYKVTVKGLLWMLQDVEQFRGAPLVDTPKVSWNQRPSDGYEQTKESVNYKSKRKPIQR